MLSFDSLDSSKSALNISRIRFGAGTSFTDFNSSIADDSSITGPVSTDDPADQPRYRDSQGRDYNLVNPLRVETIGPERFVALSRTTATGDPCPGITISDRTDSDFLTTLPSYLERAWIGIPQGCRAGLISQISYDFDSIRDVTVYYFIDQNPNLSDQVVFRVSVLKPNGTKVLVRQESKLAGQFPTSRYGSFTASKTDFDNSGANLARGDLIFVELWLENTNNPSGYTLAVSRIEVSGR